MSNDESWSMAAPPFKADDALVQIRRALRDLKLAERGTAYEMRGKRVVELALDGAKVNARLARRPMLTPEWDRFAITSAAEQRKLIDEIKTRLARWEQED